MVPRNSCGTTEPYMVRMSEKKISKASKYQEIERNIYRHYNFILGLTLLELQSRFGDTPVKFQVVCPKLSPKRDCSPKRVKSTATTYKPPASWAEEQSYGYTYKQVYIHKKNSRTHDTVRTRILSFFLPPLVLGWS